MIPLQRKFFALGEWHLDCTNKDVRNVATALFAHHEKFFVFVHHEGVEPTNTELNARGARWCSGAGALKQLGVRFCDQSHTLPRPM